VTICPARCSSGPSGERWRYVAGVLLAHSSKARRECQREEMREASRKSSSKDATEIWRPHGRSTRAFDQLRTRQAVMEQFCRKTDRTVVLYFAAVKRASMRIHVVQDGLVPGEFGCCARWSRPYSATTAWPGRGQRHFSMPAHRDLFCTHAARRALQEPIPRGDRSMCPIKCVR